MAFVNENYCNLKESFLFADIAHKVSAYAEAHPDKKIIRLGIGDVTLPLAKCCSRNGRTVYLPRLWS